MRFHAVFISRFLRSCFGLRTKMYDIDGSIEGTENFLPCGGDDISAAGQQCVSGIVLEPPRSSDLSSLSVTLLEFLLLGRCTLEIYVIGRACECTRYVHALCYMDTRICLGCRFANCRTLSYSEMIVTRNLKQTSFYILYKSLKCNPIS